MIKRRPKSKATQERIKTLFKCTQEHHIVDNMVMYRKLAQDGQFTDEQRQQFFNYYRDLTRSYLGADFDSNYESLDDMIYLCIYYNLDNDKTAKVLEIMEYRKEV